MAAPAAVVCALRRAGGPLLTLVLMALPSLCRAEDGAESGAGHVVSPQLLSAVAVAGLLLLAAMAWWRYRSVLVLNRRLAESVAALTSAQAAIQTNEDRFRDFAECASDWLWEMDERFRLTMYTGTDPVNGLDPAKAIGKTPWEMVGDDPESRLWRRHRDDLEAHRPFSGLEVDSRGREGRIQTVRVNGKPVFDSQGAFKGYRGVATDITESKRAEAALRNNERLLREVIDGMPFAFHLWDAEERLVMCNSTQREWSPHLRDVMRVGARYEEQVRATMAQGLVDVPAEDPESYVRTRLDQFRNPERHRNEQIRVGDRWVQMINRKLPDGRTLCIRLDVTEARASEERLRRVQKMEAVGQLTGGVAHDFNNLLGVILGNAELLSDRLGADNRQLAAVLRAAERGAELTQRLLAFSRKQALRPRAIDLDASAESMSELLQRTLGATIEIDVRRSERLWHCHADPGQLENALLNLAVNALDAMPEGGRLTIATANVELGAGANGAGADGADGGEFVWGEPAPGPYVMLSVADSGTGIAPDALPRVFEPFFTTKEVGKGSGLGLSMVYGFARQSGGHLAIDSEPGKGTTVRLYLPKATAEELSDETADAAMPRSAPDEVVLVVEDDPDLLALTVSHLSALGYRTLKATDGSSGIAALRQAPRVDLLLTDVMLPGGSDGLRLAEQARRSREGLKVLFMSGYPADGVARRSRRGQELPLLQKPFRRSDVARAVRRALDAEAA